MRRMRLYGSCFFFCRAVPCRDASVCRYVRLADDVLLAGVRSVTDLMVNPGLINLDFADVQVRTIYLSYFDISYFDISHFDISS